MKLLTQIALIIFVFSFCACKKDLSKETPFSQAIGKSFIVQSDLYVFNMGGNIQEIGPLTWASAAYLNVPTEVSSKYIGFEIPTIKLQVTGIVKGGTKVTIRRILQMKSSHFFPDICYLVSLEDSDKSTLFGTGVITNNPFNPPESSHWSDPPIFDAAYLLPVPEDGVWWK